MAAWLGHAEATRRIAQQNYEDRPTEALLNLAIPEKISPVPVPPPARLTAMHSIECAIVLVAGAVQFLAGLFRLGPWFRAMSPAVIQDMLAGIGMLIDGFGAPLALKPRRDRLQCAGSSGRRPNGSHQRETHMHFPAQYSSGNR